MLKFKSKDVICKTNIAIWMIWIMIKKAMRQKNQKLAKMNIFSPKCIFILSRGYGKKLCNFHKFVQKWESYGYQKFFKNTLDKEFSTGKIFFWDVKKLWFALKNATFTQLPQGFPQPMGKMRKKQSEFCRIYKVHKCCCGKPYCSTYFFDFCLTLGYICGIIMLRKYIHPERNKHHGKQPLWTA